MTFTLLNQKSPVYPFLANEAMDFEARSMISYRSVCPWDPFMNATVADLHQFRTPEKSVQIAVNQILSGEDLAPFLTGEADAILLSLSRAEADAFTQALAEQIQEQVRSVGEGHVAIVQWGKPNAPKEVVVGVLETRHTNVSLLVVDEVAHKFRKQVDCYIIGFTPAQVHRLSSPEIRPFLVG